MSSRVLLNTEGAAIQVINPFALGASYRLKQLGAQVRSEVALRLMEDPADTVFAAYTTNTTGSRFISGSDTATQALYQSPWCNPGCNTDSFASDIDRIVDNEDSYEQGESRPTPEAIAKAKHLVRAAQRARGDLPKPDVAVYFGELDITWRRQNRLLRLIVYSEPDRLPLLYYQTDTGDTLTRGQSQPLTSDSGLIERLNWLLG